MNRLLGATAYGTVEVPTGMPTLDSPSNAENTSVNRQDALSVYYTAQTAVARISNVFSIWTNTIASTSAVAKSFGDVESVEIEIISRANNQFTSDIVELDAQFSQIVDEHFEELLWK